MLRLHSLQHVEFEDAAEIASWASGKGHRLAVTRLYQGQSLPALEELDWLVVMGGPMGADDTGAYPWLSDEKKLIRRAIEKGKTVLGICLGAQLIASSLGARVFKNAYKEIGWFPVSLTEEGEGASVFSGFPSRFTAFHWHGDTFGLPAGSLHAARSEACANQAFLIGDRVVGLQFHLECSGASIERLLENCAGELISAPFIQREREIRGPDKDIAVVNRLLFTMLDNLERLSGLSPS